MRFLQVFGFVGNSIMQGFMNKTKLWSWKFLSWPDNLIPKHLNTGKFSTYSEKMLLRVA